MDTIHIAHFQAYYIFVLMIHSPFTSMPFRNIVSCTVGAVQPAIELDNHWQFALTISMLASIVYVPSSSFTV